MASRGITGGNSRQQILKLFSVNTIEQLREQASHVWNAHYCEDGQTSLLLANSLWLDEAFDFPKEAAERLANHYFASSCRGNLGTEEMNRQLQTWLDANTGDLLKEQTQDVKLSPRTVFALASTVCFAADWNAKFYAGNTKNAVFHGQKGDLQTPFMNQTYHQHTYFQGAHFGAISLDPGTGGTRATTKSI